VFCPIEAQHRDLHVARDAISGRFRNAGVTLDLGQPPDWQHGGLADDEEWHIEWSKFYFGLDLAHAFSVTEDRSYLDAWQGLVASWIDQREPDCDPPEVTARRVQNWLYAWQGFDRVPGFTGWTPSSRTGCWPAWPCRSTTSRPTSPPSATTAPSSCSPSWSSRWDSPSSTRAAPARHGPGPTSRTTCSPTCGATECTASAPATTT
jgi:hypothetical protein